MVSRLNFSTSAEARVSILLYDALDFSTDRNDGGGQTRESLSRIASSSAAVAGLDPVRFAHQVRRSRQVLIPTENDRSVALHQRAFSSAGVDGEGPSMARLIRCRLATAHQARRKE